MSSLEHRTLDKRQRRELLAETKGLKRFCLSLTGSDADADDLRARDLDARRKGVTGVPCFVVARSHVVSGAQPPDLWLKVIDELAERHADAAR